MNRFIDNIRARITNAGYSTQNRTISLIANWLANTLWLIESRFLGLARETYGQNEVVYACLRMLSQSVPEPPLIAYQQRGDKRTALPPDHELMRLIRLPNELMTEYELWELVTLHVAIIGRSTWWKERDNAGRTIALWPLRPDRVGPRYSDSDKVGERVLWGYNYQVPGSGVIVPLPRRDVLAFNFPDPTGESGGIVEGLGPVMAVARQVAGDNEATKFVGALLANYAAPTVAVKIKGKVKDENEAQLIKNHFRSQFGGSRRGEPAVVDGETEIQVIGFNLRELEFPELREVSESRIAACIGVPPILVGLRVGLKMGADRSNFEASRRFFTETTLANYWRRFQDQVTIDLASEWGDDIVCEFDTSKVKALAGVLVEQAQPIVDAFTRGVATVADYRAALHLEPFAVEDGEVIYIPSTVTVVPVTEVARAAREKRLALALRPEPMPEPLALASGEGEDDEVLLPTGKSVAALKVIDPRDQAEREMRMALGALFAEWGEETAARIAAGEVLAEETLMQQLRSILQVKLAQTATAEALRLATNVGVQFDPALVNDAMVSWAKDYSYELVNDLDATTRKVLQSAISTYASTPGMTRAELEALISPAFGEARASMIAVTEVTRSYSQAMAYYQKQMADAGITMRRRWVTNADELVCPQCAPLNRLYEDEWPDAAKGGPPRHPACRCSVVLKS